MWLVNTLIFLIVLYVIAGYFITYMNKSKRDDEMKWFSLGTFMEAIKWPKEVF